MRSCLPEVYIWTQINYLTLCSHERLYSSTLCACRPASCLLDCSEQASEYAFNLPPSSWDFETTYTSAICLLVLELPSAG